MTVLVEAIEQSKLELAQKKHTPTHAMRTVAKRGVRLAAGRNLDPAAVSVGRRIASGQPLTNEHVEHMASYNAALDSPPVGTDDDTAVEHMLWGGKPGAQWSSSRMAAIDVSGLAEHDSPSILQLDEEGKGVSLEVFVRDGMGEPTHLDKEKSLIWAPILRSGMLAMRPGSNGEKKAEPLVFVGGHASDPRKEIGLQNLVDSFREHAIQHVTIPTNHDNGVLDNTGFIKDLKIVESKKRPGEQVLVAAHDFRDPDVRKKVELGTIANRSCGIVYDYVNTETGKSYTQALDHVALTNKPWVTGMAAYGELRDDEDFSSREVVPMLLSESHTELGDVLPTNLPFDDSKNRFGDKEWQRSCVLDCGEGDPKQRFSLPIREPDGTLNANAVHEVSSKVAPFKGASLPQKKAAARSLVAAHRKLGSQPPSDLIDLVSASTNMSQAERAALNLADVQWGADELSMNDITDQVVACLGEMGDPDEVYPIFSVRDVVAAPDPKALVHVDYGDPEGVRDAWVIPLEVDGDKVSLSDFSGWTPVQKEWVTDEDAAQDKSEVSDLIGDKTVLSEDGIDLAALTAKERKALPDSAFVFPASREYPIHDKAHAINALQRGATNETGARLRTIRSKVYSKYPALKPGSKTNMSLTSDPLKGGAMKPTVQEALERLGLSEEQRAVIQPLLDENSSLKSNLAEVSKKSREDSVKTRVQQLQGEKFPPGFCRRFEEIALGDDGDVAAVLNLSEGDKQTGERDYTATQIAESLIAALPRDDSGALALAERGDLTTSPLGDRPPVDAADQKKVQDKEGKRPVDKDADEWLSELEQLNPGLAEQVGMQLSTAKKEG